MRKVLALIMAALLMMFAFAACGETTPDDGATQAATEAVADSDFKVAIIHIGDPATGSGYSYAHDQGLVEAQATLGLTDDQIIRKNNIPDDDAAATRQAIEAAIDDGAKVVFTTSYGYMDTTEALAQEYPEIIFSHATGYKSNDTNFNNYFGRIYQARYLAGIAAGLKTETNKLGYVAAYGTDLAETCSGINAFALGAQSVNPDVEVYVKVLNSWADETNETGFAEALIEMGCDIIAQHCDSANPQIAAQSKGVFGCGYNSDMTAQAPEAHLTAPVWNWGVYYTEAIKAVQENKWETFGNYFGGIKDGFIDISPLSANVAEGTQEKIDAVKELFTAGTWDVFSGVKLSFDEDNKVVQTEADLLNAAGETVVKAGEASFDDGVIKGSMNYYVKGVSEK